MDFASRYEISTTAEFVRSRGYKRVALQFPDELLEDATRLAKALRAELGKGVVLYVMADTAYGSCCVDEVAASHVDAECVVHYGHACCSPTSTLPALFVFGKTPINVNICVESLYKCLSTSEKPVLVLFGLEFAHVLDAIKKEIANKLSESGVTLPEPIFADVSCFNIDPTKMHITEERGTNAESDDRNNSNASSSYSLGGLTWSMPANHRMEQYLLFWIGSDNPAFTNVMLMFNSCETVRYDAKENCLVKDRNLHRKVLNRRYYLVEKAKDANIVGILVGTLGIAGYLNMVQQMKKLIERAGKKSYTLVMGRPSAAKLANFPECDVFVYVSCAQTALLDSKEFLAPVITPFEAMLAFQRGSHWTGEYVIEFRNLMQISEPEVREGKGEEEEARFSFLQGGYVEDSRHEVDGDEHREKSIVLAELTHKALSLKKEQADSILFKGTAKSGVQQIQIKDVHALSMQELLQGHDRPKAHMIRVIEGFETVMFRSKFDTWTLTETNAVAVSEDGRGKVAALLKRQGLNVKGLMKADPVKEELQPYIDCTGNLQVWRVNDLEKVLIPSSEQSKFYSGDCYIFQYSYPGDDREDYLVGTWFGNESTVEERASAISLSSEMVESLKHQAVFACIHQGKEPIQFFSIFQSFIVYKGGISSGYKKYVTDNAMPDETYSEGGIALFRVQGSGPENMQAIQVEPVSSSLNSSYCYILHSGNTVFTWSGSLATTEDQELMERQLDLIKPNVQSKPQKEGSESELFWNLLGGKYEYPSQRISKNVESDPHLFSCTFSEGNLKATEIFNFTQDDLMTEDILILDCHSDIFVWVGKQVDSKTRSQALNIGTKFIEHDFLMEKLSGETAIFVVTEGNEPAFFTRFFTWDAAKSSMHGDSFQRKLAIVKNGVAPALDKPKRRTPTSLGGRSSVPEKSQRSRSVSSFSPDRVRVRGRSPAFNALAANFENPSARNLSTPPPVVKKLYPKSGTPDSSTLAPRSSAAAAAAALSSSFEEARGSLTPQSSKASPETEATNGGKDGSAGTSVEHLSIQEDVKEGAAQDEEGLPTYPYERLKVTSSDPVTGIDVTKRETYLSPAEFREKLGMPKDAFFKLPKWKQNKLKMAVQLF